MIALATEHEQEPRRYASERDMWVVLVVWVLVISLLLAGVNLARAPIAPVVKYLLEASCIVFAVLAVWILYGTRYLVTHDQLMARCGPFTTTVPLASIERIVPSSDPRSSPALSLDRLHIQYRGSKDGLLISPARRGDFLDTMVQRCANLAVRDSADVQRDDG